MIDLSEITERKITEKYESLPQDLKDVLSSIKTSTAIENIAAKYRLNEEKTTMLIQLVGLVILEFASFENMKEEMKETIDISPQFIPLIADEIRQKIFSPVINSLQKIIVVPTAPVAPALTTISPRPVEPPTAPISARPVDEYREPIVGPEVVDLRKAPPSPAEAGYGGQRPPVGREGGSPPGLPTAATPIPPMPRPAPPLTFTHPIKPPKSVPTVPTIPVPPPPLIEAEPHQIPAPESRPQYIMRPSGAPPTNLPDNVLDLRKDKGEF